MKCESKKSVYNYNQELNINSNKTINRIIHRKKHTSIPHRGRQPYIYSLLIIFLLSQTFAFAEIRYVSKTGSSTPPYTSWETASDSIQKAINISNFGDTIYVANGVYKEQVVMIPGLSLIGSGMDSCIIDTREFVTPQDFYVITISDSILVRGFRIIVSNIPSNYDLWGTGFKDPSGRKKYGIIEFNRIEQVRRGFLISLGADSIYLRNNLLFETRIGFDLSGIIHPSNFFIEENYISGVYGIIVGPAGQAYIKNNVISVRNHGGITRVSDNAIYAENNIIIRSDTSIQNFGGGGYGINSSRTPNGVFINNVVIGAFNSYSIQTLSQNQFINNIVINGKIGFRRLDGDNPIIKYNNSWNNSNNNYQNLTPDSTNLSVNPMFNDTSGWDFRLQKYSPMIDAGDPSILDLDGTRSDMGAFGGPFGMLYDYEDLAPGKPRGLELIHKKEELILKWRINTESDVTGYNIYYDSVPNFPLTSKTFFINNEDTVADISRLLVYGYPRIYIKVTAIDSSGNESPPSEEVLWGTSELKEEGTVPQEYQLFQNFPNPFNPSTTIGYRLKERGYVKLIVYDIKGETVEVLINNWLERGYYEVGFNPVNKEKGFASGIYLYKLEVINENRIPVFTDIKKMILLK